MGWVAGKEPLLGLHRKPHTSHQEPKARHDYIANHSMLLSTGGL